MDSSSTSLKKGEVGYKERRLFLKKTVRVSSSTIQKRHALSHLNPIQTWNSKFTYKQTDPIPPTSKLTQDRNADDRDEENVIQRTALDLGGRKATDTIEVYGVSREELTAPRMSLSLRI